MADPKLAWPAKPTLLGTHVQRLDAPEKVTGRAKYTYDINRPGMIYGKIVRSPHPHARVVSIDLSAAQKAPGVKAVLEYSKPAPNLKGGREIKLRRQTRYQRAGGRGEHPTISKNDTPLVANYSSRTTRGSDITRSETKVGEI